MRDSYTGRYVLNCPMIEHQDNDMMRLFEIVAEDINLTTHESEQS
jgi:FtsP/CotA-like multicopper oxidase with cupredoxin domain